MCSATSRSTYVPNTSRMRSRSAKPAAMVLKPTWRRPISLASSTTTRAAKSPAWTRAMRAAQFPHSLGDRPRCDNKSEQPDHERYHDETQDRGQRSMRLESDVGKVTHRQRRDAEERHSCRQRPRHRQPELNARPDPLPDGPPSSARADTGRMIRSAIRYHTAVVVMPPRITAREDVCRSQQRFGRSQHREEDSTDTPRQCGNANRFTGRAEGHPSFPIGRLSALPKPDGAHRITVSADAYQHRHDNDREHGQRRRHPARAADPSRPDSAESAQRRTGRRRPLRHRTR